MILDHIVWPSAITVMLEGDAEPESDDDEEQDHQDVGRISGYLRMFIQNGIEQHAGGHTVHLVD